MIRIASFNVENLFARPKAFDLPDWNAGKPVLKAYEKVSALLQKPGYSATDKIRIRDLLVTLDIYTIDHATGVIRRNQTLNPKWAWLRKNRRLRPSRRKGHLRRIALGRCLPVWPLSTSATPESRGRF